MSIIYTPSGKAREYSPLSVNLYTGCNHGCIYCYVPRILRKSNESVIEATPRRNVLQELEKDCKKFYRSKDQVLFSFMTDPYNSTEMELGIMREALKMMLKYEIPVNILTKAGMNIFRDIDVIKKFGKHISIGATMTFDNDKDSKTYEPNAATPSERENMLSEMHKNGVRTWISFEPVIIPEQTINIIKKTLQIADYVKIGKINNYNQLDKTIDWAKFLQESIDILRTSKKPFYVKYDLRVSAPEIKLYGNEILPDEFNVPQFEDKEQDFLYE